MIPAPPVAPHDVTDVTQRLRNILLRANFDCGCRETLAGALDRFTALEQRRQVRSGIAAARDHKARIVNILHFLSELDEVTDGESDRTVFEEMALLFIDIADCATAGASALRAISDAES
jgi:hypothetical protein